MLLHHVGVVDCDFHFKWVMFMVVVLFEVFLIVTNIVLILRNIKVFGGDVDLYILPIVLSSIADGLLMVDLILKCHG